MQLLRKPMNRESLPTNILRKEEFSRHIYNYDGSQLDSFLLCLYRHGNRYEIARFALVCGFYRKLVRTVAVYDNAILALDGWNLRIQELMAKGLYPVRK